MTSDENTTPTSIAWVKQYVGNEVENLVGMLGEEVALMQKAEREEVERQFELMRRALEIQANRIADLEALIAAPAKRSPALEKTTPSLIAGRAS